VLTECVMGGGREVSPNWVLHNLGGGNILAYLTVNNEPLTTVRVESAVLDLEQCAAFRVSVRKNLVKIFRRQLLSGSIVCGDPIGAGYEAQVRSFLWQRHGNVEVGTVVYVMVGDDDELTSQVVRRPIVSDQADVYWPTFWAVFGIMITIIVLAIIYVPPLISGAA
jgi:hypothetical protein